MTSTQGVFVSIALLVEVNLDCKEQYETVVHHHGPLHVLYDDLAIEVVGILPLLAPPNLFGAIESQPLETCSKLLGPTTDHYCEQMMQLVKAPCSSAD